MNEANSTGLTAIIESVGGPDMFIWIVMFSVLLLGAGALVFFNREEI
ncbi:MAG: hypothetical protein U9R50_09690 [Campylobacterota bacterium]|nr:hypothetical protein [Campylobacterota bacterium]